jgi:hypothetical protein
MNKAVRDKCKNDALSDQAATVIISLYTLALLVRRVIGLTAYPTLDTLTCMVLCPSDVWTYGKVTGRTLCHVDTLTWDIALLWQLAIARWSDDVYSFQNKLALMIIQLDNNLLSTLGNCYNREMLVFRKQKTKSLYENSITMWCQLCRGLLIVWKYSIGHGE